MARLNWLGGSYSGKLGASVGGSWKGTKTAREYREKIHDAKTESQLDVRALFRAAGKIAKATNANWLNVYWKKVKKMTPYNYFIKANKPAFQKSGVAYADLKFPSGNLGQPLTFASAPSLSGSTISLTFPAPSALEGGTPTKYMMAIYDPSSEEARAVVFDAAAGAKELSFAVAPTGTNVYVFAQAGTASDVNYCNSWEVNV
jgi:hypothetical protein